MHEKSHYLHSKIEQNMATYAVKRHCKRKVLEILILKRVPESLRVLELGIT